MVGGFCVYFSQILPVASNEYIIGLYYDSNI